SCIGVHIDPGALQVEDRLVPVPYRIGHGESLPPHATGERVDLRTGPATQDQDVQVLQFGTAEDASVAASAVSPDGYSVGATSGNLKTLSHVDWVATPHFFRMGR